MKATIKLRKILAHYDCTFTINNEQQFEVFVTTQYGDETGVFTGKSFSVVVGYVYAWMERVHKQKKNETISS